MIHFCHISPTKYLDIGSFDNTAHLLLAHLAEENGKHIFQKEYVNFYKNRTEPKILDNSAFEMYKQGREMFSAEKLIDIAKSVNADYIVLPDYPSQHSTKTIEAAIKWIPIFKKEGFKVFFVPQSEIGNFDQYIDCLMWAVLNRDVDMIGISILGVPNAYGVEKNNKLQRFLSRWKLMNYLVNEEHRLHPNWDKKRFHFLGMVDGPNEIQLVKQFERYIYSWDSSSAIWLGLNGEKYDSSPTGLINGKFELEVNFNIDKIPNDTLFIDNIKYNKKIIHKMIV